MYGLLDAKNLLIDAQIPVGEGNGAEVLLDVFAAAPGVYGAEALHGVDHLIHVRDEITGVAIEDDLGSSAAREDDRRRATSHRLDHDEAKGFLPLQREEQGLGACVKLSLEGGVRFA